MRLALLVLVLCSCGATDVTYNPTDGSGGGSQGAGGGNAGGGTANATGGGGFSGAGGGAGGSGGGVASSCSPTTCPSGCCGALNNCLAGTSNSACGKSGAVCTACLTAQACGASTRVCETPFDPNQQFTVIATSAQVSTSTSWDDLSDPDCGLQFYCPSSASSVTATADVRGDTSSPTWTTTSGTCRLSAMQLISGGFAFSAYDEDLLSNDTITAKMTVTPTMAELLAGSKTVTGAAGLTSITFRFSP